MGESINLFLLGSHQGEIQEAIKEMHLFFKIQHPKIKPISCVQFRYYAVWMNNKKYDGNMFYSDLKFPPHIYSMALITKTTERNKDDSTQK